MPQSVAVVMGTFNGERFLKQQLDSIASQSRLPDELIVRDDCSSDRTLEILEAFAGSVTFRVVILRGESNVGFRENFSRAVKEVTADWFLFCDQDDVWLPEKIATIAPLIESDEKVMVVHEPIFVNESLERLEGDLDERLKLHGWRREWFVHGCCMAVRTDFAQACIDRRPDFYSHDDWIAYLANALGFRVDLDEQLILYRGHEGNLSRAHRIGVAGLRHSIERHRQRVREHIADLKSWDRRLQRQLYLEETASEIGAAFGADPSALRAVGERERLLRSRRDALQLPIHQRFREILILSRSSAITYSTKLRVIDFLWPSLFSVGAKLTCRASI